MSYCQDCKSDYCTLDSGAAWYYHIREGKPGTMRMWRRRGMVLLHSSISPSLRLQVLMDNVLTLPETEAVGWQTWFLADNHVRQWQISEKKSPVIWAQSLGMTGFFAVYGVRKRWIGVFGQWIRTLGSFFLLICGSETKNDIYDDHDMQDNVIKIGNESWRTGGN